ncbi:MAG: hypothetical protein QHH06_11760 [Clostridiales bacterium]|nr:hypothetical protein [Eubacteriales bacterium]MDH7567134.1 hypothetical protein [Clostridiales bacterium]
MLDLSQLESGHFKLCPEDFNLVELLHIALRKFSKKVEDKNIRVEIHCPADTILVHADVFRIEQVLVNFISNAIRHVPPRRENYNPAAGEEGCHGCGGGKPGRANT